MTSGGRDSRQFEFSFSYLTRTLLLFPCSQLQDVYLHVFVTRSPGLAVVTRPRTGEGGKEEGGEDGMSATEVELQGHDGYSPLHGVVPLLKRQVRGDGGWDEEKEKMELDY